MYTIDPSSNHAMPASPVLMSSASVTDGPPATGIFLSRPSWMKASSLPSGEKTGILAPDVPPKGRACSASRSLIQMESPPDPPDDDAYASIDPSGDSASVPATRVHGASSSGNAR